MTIDNRPTFLYTFAETCNPRNETSFWKTTSGKIILYILTLSVGTTLIFLLGLLDTKSYGYDYHTGYYEKYMKVCKKNSTLCKKSLCNFSSKTHIFGCFIPGVKLSILFVGITFLHIILFYLLINVSLPTLIGLETNQKNIKLIFLSSLAIFLIYPAVGFFITLVFNNDIQTGYQIDKINYCSNEPSISNIDSFNKNCIKSWCYLRSYNLISFCILEGGLLLNISLFVAIHLILFSVYFGFQLVQNCSSSFNQTKNKLIYKITGYETYNCDNDIELVEKKSSNNEEAYNNNDEDIVYLENTDTD